MTNMKPTEYQAKAQELVKAGKSFILVAPTGLGKTFAVTGDLLEHIRKTVYAVPLRALGNDISRSVTSMMTNAKSSIFPVIHHGGIQDSTLFSEDFIITTYDQVVCGVPGLPLSLPLKAGHAVAGALLMSRLVFDEAHLAWGISEQALSILLAIIKFRARFGLQTILMTATLPDSVSKFLADELGVERILVGNGGEVESDEALLERDRNRKVKTGILELKKVQGQLDLSPLDKMLSEGAGNKIYFANTVDRLQATYDRLVKMGVEHERILVLHNRMPHAWRKEVEERVKARFGKDAVPGNWILLTNQVAEAGLDISAPLVITDPAPVDTLVQRAGRCARWFREGETNGVFFVLKVPGLNLSSPSEEAKSYALPYRLNLVVKAVNTFPKDKELSWNEERGWVNLAWGGENALEAVQQSINNTTFALNLFDRAAQESKPGEIAKVFREILSIEVAVEEGEDVRIDDLANRDLQTKINQNELPDTSSISLGKAYSLINNAFGRCAVIRYDKEENQLVIRKTESVQLGDILVLPSAIAYLHKQKGLCFDEARDGSIILSSEWSVPNKNKKAFSPGVQKRQSLFDHTKEVMDGTYKKLANAESLYRQAVIKILSTLENIEDAKQVEELADLIANLAKVAAGFHDIGKADGKWQKKVREIDPDFPKGELVGRSLSAGKKKIGIPHTPPSYVAIIAACRLLLGLDGKSNGLDTLIRAIALAACRHHSSLLNPARVEHYNFDPHPETIDFVQEVLSKVEASPEVLARASEIIEAAKILPSLDEVPLMLPNEDLFPIYALVGRAILMADREDAGGKPMESLQ